VLTQSAPGVYYQTVDAGAPPVTLLRTDITGFVGLAARGPIDVPIPIQSWRQFVSWFGDFTGSGFLAYAVRAFFENGGRRCWVVRVAAKDAAAGAQCASVLVGHAGDPVWRVRASSEGIWGDALTFTLRERNPAQIVTNNNDPEGVFSVVPNVSGFRRGTHVRCSSESAPVPVWKVVATVDPHRSRIYWVDPEKSRRLDRYDGPLQGLDLGAPIVIRSVEYALTVFESGRLIRFYDNLSLIPEADGYAAARLAPPQPTMDPATGAFVARPPEPVVIEELRVDLTDIRGLDVDPAVGLRATGGRDGLATLTVDDFVGVPIGPADGPDAVAVKRRGLRALESISEIGLLAIPDAQVRPIALNPVVPPPPCVPDPCIENPPPLPSPVVRGPAELPPTFGINELFLIQSEMILQCERLRDRFALLDSPFDASTSALAGIRGIGEWRSRFDTKFAALYFPWVKVVDPLFGAGAGITRLVPPSGHVAGVVAGTDLDVGVHKAPANRRIEWAVDASVTVGDEEHGILNANGINALRTTGGRGLRVQGARTVSSDTDWRFVNVRRLISMIEKALESALQWAVFEPNDVFTRARATMTVTIFLLGLHERGMLAGATPEESFEIKCDLDNNPDAERDLGRLIIEIRVAPSKPFEFVVLRVGRVRDALEVTDAADAFSISGLADQ
jgi:Bacteriophage tail sheath protein